MLRRRTLTRPMSKQPLLCELTESSIKRCPKHTWQHDMLLCFASSKACSASTSTSNFCWSVSSLNLYGSLGLSMLLRINLWLAHGRHHHGHLELNRSVIQVVMRHLACQPLEVLRLHFRQVVLRLSGVQAWRAASPLAGPSPSMHSCTCLVSGFKRHHQRTPLCFGRTCHSSGYSLVHCVQ